MWELFCKGREDVKEHATICSKEECMTHLKAYFLQKKVFDSQCAKPHIKLLQG
jgi:hypothetical protein